ncbi:hypothetical protein [Brasilonema sp. UFV-L1]|uniref:hypothetical protein n=1 Tax=Brasilonema sp. UFV-L1 TaxID=2234130 RepID=UPI001B7D21DC|nr:hypothetical protein [Brasilonema sp. UFV-L1]
MSSGQWLADTIIVAQLGYDYGKRQNISSSTDSARMGQVGECCSKKRNFVSRIDKRLRQAITKFREGRLLSHPVPLMTFGIGRGVFVVSRLIFPTKRSTVMVGNIRRFS